MGDVRKILDWSSSKTSPQRDRAGVYNEIARYAERALGVLVRRGQQGPDRYISARNQTAEGGLRKSLEFFKGKNERQAAFVYAEASEQAWEAAIEKCRANGSLARAQVEAALTSKPPEWVANYDRPETFKKRARVDVERALNQTLDQLFSMFDGLDAIFPDKSVYAEVDYETSYKWSNELDQLVGKLNSLRKDVKKGLTYHA